MPRIFYQGIQFATFNVSSQTCFRTMDTRTPYQHESDLEMWYRLYSLGLKESRFMFAFTQFNLNGVKAKAFCQFFGAKLFEPAYTSELNKIQFFIQNGNILGNLFRNKLGTQKYSLCIFFQLGQPSGLASKAMMQFPGPTSHPMEQGSSIEQTLLAWHLTGQKQATTGTGFSTTPSQRH